jgi:hypothetical protein
MKNVNDAAMRSCLFLAEMTTTLFEASARRDNLATFLDQAC